MKFAIAVVCFAGCGGGPAEILNPPRDSYHTWQKIEVPGTTCGDGSQYKLFVNFSDSSDNLAVVLEPGGACWDYETCTDTNAVRSQNITDERYAIGELVSPFVNRYEQGSPTKDWNLIYLPYCTGDAYTSNRIATYQDHSGTNPDLIIHHKGRANIAKIVPWIDENFTHVPKLLVTGCSAGGVGAFINYRSLRTGIHAVEKGYLLDDSGPVFSSNGYSGRIHAKIREAWDLGGLNETAPTGFEVSDLTTYNTAMADEFPDDRIAMTYFLRDNVFSQLSYASFYNFPPKEQIMQMWASDSQQLVALYETRQNLHYFLPYWRDIDSSHCATLFTFNGSDIEDRNTTLASWVDDFLNDMQLTSMIEAPVPGEDP